MIHYPLKFQVRSQTAPGISTSWTTHSESLPAQPLTCAIPPEFEGPGGGFSPEDFYAFAAINCFAATFKVIAEKSKLVYGGLSLALDLTVDRDEKGAPWMAKADFQVTLSGVGEATERAQRILEKTSQSCLVLNSTRTEKSFQFQVLT